MARDKMVMNYGTDDLSVSASKTNIKAQSINTTNGAVIDGFFKAKDNSAYLLVNATQAGAVILKAGNAFSSNNILGDLEIAVETGINVIQVERAARFENKDASLMVDFKKETAGTICAFGKKAGVR